MQKVITLALVTVAGIAAADRAVVPLEPPILPAPSRRSPPRNPIPQAPRVDPAISQLGKRVAGSYTCKGVSLNPDGSSSPIQATLSIRLALDDAWIAVSFVEGKSGIKVDDYRTYDPIAKQWTRVQLASTSGHVISTSLGEKDGTWLWDGTESSSIGTVAVRDYEQLTGKRIKIWGEAMRSGTWQKQYEVTCSR